MSDVVRVVSSGAIWQTSFFRAVGAEIYTLRGHSSGIGENEADVSNELRRIARIPLRSLAKTERDGTGKPASAYINDLALQIINLLSNGFRLLGWEEGSEELRFEAGVRVRGRLHPTAVYFRWAVLCPDNTLGAQPGLAAWFIPVDSIAVALFEPMLGSRVY